MSSDIVIKIEKLTKNYHIYEKPKDRLLQMLYRGKKQFFKEFSALNEISLSVKKGDSVGVLGHNGAGKSTLLQLLTGTLTPTSGKVEVTGRVAALLELGAGFNPEFTGKENVYMNATILGLTKNEIDRKYDDILDFASIGDFIGRPVKTYSSGMYVRLAFAVAVHTDPDVLIIDEALAVGDIRFQMKCLQHMENMKANGTTILFVSHSPEQVKRFCNKAIWLNGGQLRASGTSNEICDKYRDFMATGDSPKLDLNSDVPTKNINKENLPARLLSTELDRTILRPGETLNLTIKYEVFDELINGLLIGAAIYRPNRDYIFGANTYLDNIEIPNTRGIHEIIYKVTSIPLLPATFEFDVGIFTDKSLVNLDYLTGIETFEIFDDYKSEGLVHIEHNWNCCSK